MEMVGQGLKGAAINLIDFYVGFVLLQRGNWKRFSLGSKTHVISLSRSGFAVAEVNCEVCPSREGTEDRRQCPAKHQVTVSSSRPLLIPDAKETLCTPAHPPGTPKVVLGHFSPKIQQQKIPTPLPAQSFKH